MERLNTTTDVLDLEDARKRLETVRPLVEEIMTIARRIRELVPAEPDEDPRKEAERAALEDCFRTALTELNRRGAILKDPLTGLIDFYTWRDGEIVFLCWKHGEPELGWWHGIREGFSGRKPL